MRSYSLVGKHLLLLIVPLFLFLKAFYAVPSGSLAILLFEAGCVQRQPSDQVKPVVRDKHLFHFVLAYDTSVPATAWCAVESLALRVQERNDTRIFVWMSKPELYPPELEVYRRLTDSTKIHSKLRKVDVVPLHFEDIIKTTPIWKLYKDPKSKAYTDGFVDQNKADALRLAVVYQYGGMYMDADVIAVKDPTVLGNGAAQQDPNVLNNAVFRFEQHSPYVYALMEEFVKGFNAGAWGAQGPGLFSRTFIHEISSNRQCYWSNKKTIQCKGADHSIDVWPTDMVYPFTWRQTSFLHEPPETGMAKIRKPSTVLIHLWNKVSKGGETNSCKRGEQTYEKTTLGTLRKQMCPISFDLKVHNCRRV